MNNSWKLDSSSFFSKRHTYYHWFRYESLWIYVKLSWLWHKNSRRFSRVFNWRITILYACQKLLFLKIIKITKLFKLDFYWNVSFSKDFHELGILLMTSSCVSKMRDRWLAVFNLYRKNDSLRFVCWKGESLKRLFQQ